MKAFVQAINLRSPPSLCIYVCSMLEFYIMIKVDLKKENNRRMLDSEHFHPAHSLLFGLPGAGSSVTTATTTQMSSTFPPRQFSLGKYL